MLAVDFIRFTVLFMYHLFGALSAAVQCPTAIRQRTYAVWGRRFLTRMGPVYVKIGQILATRSDLIPEVWISELKILQDAMPYMSERATKAAIERQLGQPIEQAFAHFDLKPVASASIAQVHFATLHSGEAVAVKLVRDGVERRITVNLSLLRFLVMAVELISPSARQLALSGRFNELSQLLLMQVDLEVEGLSQEEVRRNFDGHAYVRIPKVHRDLSNRKMLVMERVDGHSGVRIDTISFNRAKLAQRLQDTIYTMLYMHGVCHGDPHPGNLFFSDHGEVYLVDFGITVRLSEEEKWGLSSFYYACTRRDWDLAIDRFTDHFVENRHKIDQNYDEYRELIGKVLRFHFDESTNQWSTITYFKDLNAVLRRYNARYSYNFTKVELVFLSCEGFARQIDPNIDIWANARAFTDRYSPYMSDEIKLRFDKFFGQKIPSSIAQRDEASRFLVAPTHIHRYFFPSRYPVFVRRATGGEIEDLDGNLYIDLSGGYGPHILGYGHPVVASAIQDEAAKGGVNAIGNLPEVELAKMIVDAFPSVDKAVLCNSGTEAVLMAVRICRASRRRSRVAKFEGHYHGWSDLGMVSSWFRFSGEKHSPKPIAGTLGCDTQAVDSTLILQYGHLNGLEVLRHHADELACVLVEPMPASVAKMDVDFLQALRDLCTELGIPLVFDEVVSGFRVAYGGAQTLAKINPDITCLGKIIGGGLPCGCVAGKSELINVARSSDDPFFDYENKAFVGGTMSGNSISCAAGTAVLRYLKGHMELYDDLAEKSRWLSSRLSEVAAQHGVAIRIAGNSSIFSLVFSHRSSSLFRDKQAGSNFKATIALAYYMRKHGIYMPELHSFLLSAAHTWEQLNAVADAFDTSIGEMAEDGFFVV